MTDVHEAYVERRRWRVWPFVLLVLLALFGIGLLVAMIMNIHGSITWPAGEVKFGFWPKEATSVAAPEIAPSARVATEIPLTPPPQAQPAQPAVPQSPPAVAPPSEPDAAPADNVPAE